MCELSEDPTSSPRRSTSNRSSRYKCWRTHRGPFSFTDHFIIYSLPTVLFTLFVVSYRYRRTQQEEVTVMQAPQFTRPLHNIETVELTNVHLECRLQPVGDSSMKVDWFVNGRPVKTGHRFRPSYEFDYVALDILGVYPDDSGVYTCQARNQLGEAVTSCSVRVHAKKDLLLESQHPEGLERIQYLEDASRYKRHELVDEVVNVKPKFITKPKNQENLRERQHAHFECKLEPVTDSNLKVEWFKNGRPVTIGNLIISSLFLSHSLSSDIFSSSSLFRFFEFFLSLYFKIVEHKMF